MDSKIIMSYHLTSYKIHQVEENASRGGFINRKAVRLAFWWLEVRLGDDPVLFHQQL